MGAKDPAHLLTTELNVFLLFELLGQMMIIESPVLPSGQFDNPLDGSFLGLALTGSAPITVNHSLGSLPTDSSLDSVTLPLADPQKRSCAPHRQLASKHSLKDLYPLLVLHRQGCHPHTLT